MRNLLLSCLFLFASACGSFKPTNKYDVSHERAQLPQEEAPHPRNSLEWWYFTGHLKDKENGKVYGVEYVFFHFNPTGKKDFQMVNFAVSDPQTQQFRYDYNYAKLPKLLTATLPVNLTQQKGTQRWTLTGQEGAFHLQARMAEHPALGAFLLSRLTGRVAVSNLGSLA